MKISIILPFINERKFISKCLSSIFEQDIDKNELEIIAIDSGSTDGTSDIVLSYLNNEISITILKNEKKIASSAFNLGINTAKGEYVLILSAHSYLEPDYLSKAMQILTEKKAANVGGAARPVGQGFMGQAIAFAHESIFGLGGGKFRLEHEEGYVDTVYLGFYKKCIFNEIGFFNEKLVRNQDIELNSRIRLKGYKIYLSKELKSYYFCRSDLLGLWKQYFANGYWNIETAIANPSAMSLRHFTPMIFVLLLSALLIAGIILKGFMSLFIFSIAIYALISMVFSMIISQKKGLKYLFVEPVIFACLHFSNGFGAVWGLINIAIKFVSHASNICHNNNE